MERQFPVVLFLILFGLISAKKMNILFLAADDMRPELGCYSGDDAPSPVHPKLVTPSLDGLAAKSLLLKRAYVQQAVCSPSRTSLLTGRRPDTTHVYDLTHYFRKVGGNYTTIPQYFKQQGYMSVGMGKIFHPGMAASGNDDPISWSVPFYHSPFKNYWSTSKASRMAVRKEQMVNHPLPDVQVTDRAIHTIRQLAPAAKSGQQPFFLAVGLHKPHLPFVFPEEFLDLYPKDEVKLPDNGYAPVDMPKVAWSSYAELRSYDDIHRLHASGQINTSLPNDVTLDLRRAYYSAISYVDYLFGTVLKELENQGLADSTIVAFWGDHGWQLGEHGEWCKHTNFELATRAPMMVRVPGLTDNGIVTEHLTEFVDLFPTLVEAAGFPQMPLCPEDSTKTEFCTEGRSLMPLMREDHAVDWKDRVFSQYPRIDGKIMGYSMRTDKYRYTEWVRFDKAPVYKPDWSTLYGAELYDHMIDSEENHNVADDARYGSVRQELSKLLHAGWRHAHSSSDNVLQFISKDDQTVGTEHLHADVVGGDILSPIGGEDGAPRLEFFSEVKGAYSESKEEETKDFEYVHTNAKFLDSWIFSDDEEIGRLELDILKEELEDVQN